MILLMHLVVIPILLHIYTISTACVGCRYIYYSTINAISPQPLVKIINLKNYNMDLRNIIKEEQCGQKYIRNKGEQNNFKIIYRCIFFLYCYKIYIN